MSSGQLYDFVAIGGGAAGYFGAIAYAESAPGSRVAILEKTGSVLGKVKISGGGRCNVTHACFDAKPLAAYYPRGQKNLIGPFHRWGASDTVNWFKARGVELKTESDGRMFPTTDDSTTIMNCLTRSVDEAGVEVRLHTGVKSLTSTDHGWELELDYGEVITSRSVLLATGGTRNGAGVSLAGDLGHEIVPASPSLFTFKIGDSRLKGLSGVSVGLVEASVRGTKLRMQGPCLITHWGLSGPAILKLSSWGARELAERNYCFEVAINWCGGAKIDEVGEWLQETRKNSPKKRVRSGVPSIEIPARLWQRLVEKSGIDDEVTWSNLSKASRSRLLENLVNSRFPVNGKSMNKDEFVTAGGVALSEVNFKTMESRVAPGLYFAGEVLDIDGVTGGFNFQAAWTTSRIAGESAAQS
tara:strand:- start:428 stop:1666 length:1239 start_codon:yes stop_codon:yes gene_type:complete